MRRVLPLLLLATAFAGCSHPAPIVGATPPGISYRFQGDDIAGPNQRAAEYCQQYGKHARLQAVNPSGTDKIAVYDCN